MNTYDEYTHIFQGCVLGNGVPYHWPYASKGIMKDGDDLPTRSHNKRPQCFGYDVAIFFGKTLPLRFFGVKNSRQYSTTALVPLSVLHCGVGWREHSGDKPIFNLCHIRVVFCQKQVSKVGKSNCIPQIRWDVITCPCPWYLHCISFYGAV